MNIEDIINKSKNAIPYINGWKKMRRAAVILPLIEINNEIHLLFEVRSKKMKSQPGDICFPGGKIEENESPKSAALREASEELNLNNIKIINELDTVIRVDGTIIHPFLGIVNDIDQLKINEFEVDHIFYVPISYLLNYKAIEVNSRLIIKGNDKFPYDLIENGENYKFREGTYTSLFYKYKSYVIWGITADMVKNFLELM